METAGQRYMESRIAAAKSQEEKELLTQLDDLYKRRLWHQFTEALRDIALAGSVSDLRGMYPTLIREVEGKLKTVELANIMIAISRAECSDPSEALDFLSVLQDEKHYCMRDPLAKIIVLSEVATRALACERQAESKAAIASARELIDSMIDVPAPIHSAFYRSAANYHINMGTAAEFYDNALQFLSYTKPETLSTEEQLQWAFDLGNAALVGEEIFNFGELLSHGVISALEGTEHEWLLLLLRAFDRGDLTEFDRVCNDANDKMVQQPVLVAHRDLVRQKITILALMELGFSKTTKRQVSFEEIAEVCRLPMEEVEYLLMRAMSLKLISGVIDGVESSYTINRVQPRVLGREPIRNMATRLNAWSAEVYGTLQFLEKETLPLLS